MSLADDMESDLKDVFFNTEDFAIGALYFPASGVSYPIQVIFDAAYESVNMEGTIPVATTTPMLRVRESALLAPPAPGDKVFVKGVWYEVLEPQPDGLGVMKLRLQEALV